MSLFVVFPHFIRFDIKMLKIISGRGWERGRTENSVRKTSSNNNTIKRSARNGRGWVSERSNVSSVRNFRSVRNGNNNKRGWVSENVSSVRNFCSVRNGNGIRGRVESGRGWARGRAENSVCETRGRGRGRVGKSI